MLNAVLNTTPLICQIYPSSTRVVENPSNSINRNSEKVIIRAELTGVTSPNAGRKTYSLYLAIEHIYSVRNLNFIVPYSFSQGLIKWASFVALAKCAINNKSRSF